MTYMTVMEGGVCPQHDQTPRNEQQDLAKLPTPAAAAHKHVFNCISADQHTKVSEVCSARGVPGLLGSPPKRDNSPNRPHAAAQAASAPQHHRNDTAEDGPRTSRRKREARRPPHTRQGKVAGDGLTNQLTGRRWPGGERGRSSSRSWRGVACGVRPGT